MFIRRIIAEFVLQNQLSSNILLTSRWNQTHFTRTIHRTALNSKASVSRDYARRNYPEINCSDVINQVLPPHELDKGKTVTPDDWRSNRESFKNTKMFRSILHELGRRKLYDAGKSYIEMINKYEPHFLSPFNEILILRFMLHCSPGFTICSDENDHKYIIDTYYKIRKAFPLLDHYSAETLILSMQRTSQWRVSLELLDDLTLLQKPRPMVYSSIIQNALKEKDIEMAWDFINKMIDAYLWPHDECWISWLQSCRESGLSQWNDGVGKMLETFYFHHSKMSCVVASEMVKFIEDLCPDYVVETSSIQDAACTECSIKLHSEFTSAEHADLKELVEKIISHDSLYASTTPVEMQKFKRFIENCSPYDVVIDGLNAIYNRRGLTLHDIANIKRTHNAKILFLGRKHLAYRKGFRDIANICQVFLCDDLTRDDVYVLYSTIYHRSNVKLISDDKMRPQLYYLIEDNRRNLFLRWQFLNQTDLARRVVFHTYLPEIHKSQDGTYHIPCVAQPSTDLTWTPAEPKHWLCVRPRSRDKPAKRSKPISPNENPTLFKLQPSVQINADGTTVIDDVVKRLDQSLVFGSSETSDQGDLKRSKPIRGLLKSFQHKYRDENRQYPRQNASSWLSDSLSQTEVNEKDVLSNVKKRFKQMHDGKEKKEKKSDSKLSNNENER